MNERFFKIYQWMLDLELPSHQLMVYAFIYTLQEMEISCMGQTYIAESVRLSKTRVCEALGALEEKGLIEKEYQSQNRAMPIKYIARVPETGTPLIGNKRNNERNNERNNKKTLVAHSRSLEEIAAKTLVSLSLPSDPNLMESILGFIDHRKKMKKPLTDRAITLNIKKAHKLSDGDPAGMTDLFNLAVERGWQGIYPEKENTKGGKSNANDTEDDEPFFKPTD